MSILDKLKEQLTGHFVPRQLSIFDTVKVTEEPIIDVDMQISMAQEYKFSIEIGLIMACQEHQLPLVRKDVYKLIKHELYGDLELIARRLVVLAHHNEDDELLNVSHELLNKVT